jgi:glutamine synthetase
MVADVLKEYADELEKAKDFDTALARLIKREITAHWRIIFNGNGYDASWLAEAEKRGLLNLKNLPDAMGEYLKPKNIKLYTEMGIYTDVEMKSHYEVKLEKYCQVLNIEVETMLEMINKDILPSAFKYMTAVSKTASDVKGVVPGAKCSAETNLLKKLDGLTDELAEKAEELASKHLAAKKNADNMACAQAYAKNVLPAMAEARAVADQIEPLIGEDYKPFPSYEDLLFRV